MRRWATVLALLVVAALAMNAQAIVLLYEDFEDEPGEGWEVYGYAYGEDEALWHLEDYRSYSGSQCGAYNSGSSDYTVDVGPNWGVALTPAMDLSSIVGPITLDFYSWVDSGIDDVAAAVVTVGDDIYAPWMPINWTTPHSQWNHLYGDLSMLAGLTDVRVGFLYEHLYDPDTGTRPPTGNEGWYIDDVRIVAGDSPVPEPSTLLLLMSGLAGVGAFTRKRFRK